MPFKSEKCVIQGTEHDRRRKLSEKQKMEIKQNKFGLSQRKLAEMYNVSRRTITFILDPEKLKQNKQSRKERGGSKIYYRKESHTKSIREHRKYKNELFKNGKLN